MNRPLLLGEVFLVLAMVWFAAWQLYHELALWQMYTPALFSNVLAIVLLLLAVVAVDLFRRKTAEPSGCPAPSSVEPAPLENTAQLTEALEQVKAMRQELDEVKAFRKIKPKEAKP